MKVTKVNLILSMISSKIRRDTNIFYIIYFVENCMSNNLVYIRNARQMSHF